MTKNTFKNRSNDAFPSCDGRFFMYVRIDILYLQPNHILTLPQPIPNRISTKYILFTF